MVILLNDVLGLVGSAILCTCGIPSKTCPYTTSLHAWLLKCKKQSRGVPGHVRCFLTHKGPQAKIKLWELYPKLGRVMFFTSEVEEFLLLRETVKTMSKVEHENASGHFKASGVSIQGKARRGVMYSAKSGGEILSMLKWGAKFSTKPDGKHFL